MTVPACAMFALPQSCSLKFLQVFPDLPAAKRLLLARLFLPVPRTLMLSALSHVVREPCNKTAAACPKGLFFVFGFWALYLRNV